MEKQSKTEVIETAMPSEEQSEIQDTVAEMLAMKALEKTIKDSMQRMYMEGVTTGVQGYISAIYEQIIYGREDGLTDGEILENVEDLCRGLLELPEEEDYFEDEEEQTESGIFVLGTVKAVPGLQ